MKKEKDRRMFERYPAIFLYMKGTNPLKIPRSLAERKEPFLNILRSYCKAGVAGLQMNYSTGAAERLTKEQQEQRIIQTTGKHRGVKLLAVLNYATGHILWKEDEQVDAVTFLSFLQSVMRTFPQGKERSS
ncbi:hypothetical protein [Paenibacillus periandrae]|uniref:hypothetical protein n=1 Tax=Paenibacillus periandrae TaxID=1761741 RepID=UPI001F08E37C|nr:hypothetical protein [Paenibacillus periandrae]